MNIDNQWVGANYKGGESFTIPDGVTSIGDQAFHYCESLESIIIPDSVTSIGDEAFECCMSLKSITIPDSITSIGDVAFGRCKSLESINIPDGVTSIGEWAFAYCESLESISISDSVTSIGEKAFWGCKSLESITIPDSVMSIGEEAFWGCKSLESITIPDSVMSIGNGAFWDCKTIITYKKVEYPSYVFLSQNTFPFIKEPSYENLMRIEEVPIKARLSLNYIESGEQFVEYVRENCDILIKQLAKNEDWNALDKIFNSKHNLLRPKQLDECMKFAVENNHHELYVLLIQYKENIGMYDKDDNRFKLEL